MQKYVCIGHAAYDITLSVDSFPVENTKMKIAPGVECGGGAAANSAFLLSKWGMTTYFVGVVGNDLYGKRIKEEFINIGTNIDYLETSSDFDTTTSYILANKSNGSRTIIVSRNKNQGVKNLDLNINFDVVLVDGEELELSKKILIENPNCLSILDAGGLKEPIVELCKYVKYLVCSEDFARGYTNMDIDINNLNTLIAIHNKLTDEFHNTVVITLGDKGSFAKIGDTYKLIPTLTVENPIDSTAAGDIFHGAFTYFISNGYSLEDALRLSNVAGALSVMKLGGKNSMPDLDKVLKVGGNNDLCNYT